MQYVFLIVPERQNWLTASYLNSDVQVYDIICGSNSTTSVELPFSLLRHRIVTELTVAYLAISCKGDSLRRLQSGGGVCPCVACCSSFLS